MIHSALSDTDYSAHVFHVSLSMLYFSVPFLLLPQLGRGELQGRRWTLIPIARSQPKVSGGKTSTSRQLKGPKKSLLQQG